MTRDAVVTAARYAAIAGDQVAVRVARTELLTAVSDPTRDPRIRSAAVGALVRGGTRADARRAWASAARDADAGVRRRAAELSPLITSPTATPLLALIGDDDPLVAETACWAAGEIVWAARPRARVVTALISAAGQTDPLVREAAVAALGAIGDEAGLPAILAGCLDKPAIRRRAVLALAPFDGPEVDAALETALTDADWQTRQAAEDLT